VENRIRKIVVYSFEGIFLHINEFQEIIQSSQIKRACNLENEEMILEIKAILEEGKTDKIENKVNLEKKHEKTK
jgi:hypothetical protein